MLAVVRRSRSGPDAWHDQHTWLLRPPSCREPRPARGRISWDRSDLIALTVLLFLRRWSVAMVEDWSRFCARPHRTFTRR